MTNRDIYVDIQGNGPALILLHSWCGSHHDWTRIIDLLKDRFTLYTWDARGHGRSVHHGETPCTLSQMAADLNNLICDYKLDKPMVVGHSMGAFILWQYLETYGQDNLSQIAIIDQTPKLVTDPTWLHGIYGQFDQDKSTAFINALQNEFAENVLKLAAFGHNAKTRKKYEENSKGMQALRAYLQNLDPLPLIDIWRDLTQADFRNLLPNITLPTLLVYGTDSNYYGEAVARYMQKTLPYNQLHLIEQADHSPHLFDPGRFVDTLIKFYV